MILIFSVHFSFYENIFTRNFIVLPEPDSTFSKYRSMLVLSRFYSYDVHIFRLWCFPISEGNIVLDLVNIRRIYEFLVYIHTLIELL